MTLVCTLCGKEVQGLPVMESELAFDSEKCRDTYRKLAGIYGHNISDMGLPDVINASFFFVDVVGLSDPLLSVRNQMEKIAVLNDSISSCQAFQASQKKKISMPTGDGMVIAFLLNPELPLQLAIQLHQKLRHHNKDKKLEEKIGIRIGLSSGPVFVMTDINNNKNLWGPGIVLARRIMDIGDNFHILIAERLAEELIQLRDEYRNIIRPISDYVIKHGQTIKVYSACSEDFGNPELPEKVVQYNQWKNT